MGIIGFDPSWILDKLLGSIKRRRDLHKQMRDVLTTYINRGQRLGEDWVTDPNLILDMERAFVPMDLWNTSSQRDESLFEVLDHYERIVIQGQPGGGKTTLTRYVMLVLAKATLNSKRRDREVNGSSCCLSLFPLWVELRECNHVSGLSDALSRVMPDIDPNFAKHKLDQGRVLLLLDGLDEITDSRQRAQILRQIGDLADRYSERGNRFVITTRVAGYNHDLLAGHRYNLFTLKELTTAQQEDLINRYYESWVGQMGNLSPTISWQTKAAGLCKDLQSSEALRRLKSNPLLLSQIALLHFQKNSLPAKKHALYRLCITHLITRRERKSKEEVSEGEIERRLFLLSEVALVLHRQLEHDACTRLELEKTLSCALASYQGVYYSCEQIPALLSVMEQEWGLLVNRSPKVSGNSCYAFANLSFQEYLVAYAVHRSPKDYWSLFKEHLCDPRWQEIVYLYVAMPGYSGGVQPVDQVINEFLNQDLPLSSSSWIRIGRCLANETEHKSRWRDEVVKHLRDLSYGELQENADALEVLFQIEPEGLEIVLQRLLGGEGTHFKRQAQTLLGKIVNSNARQYLCEVLLMRLSQEDSERNHIALAEALGQIGDARLGQYAEISFQSGRRVKGAFRIGKYPITNEEYRRFVGSRPDRLPDHWQCGTYPFGKANHPVTHVSFEDAEMYCIWLSSQKQHVYRLPTSAEWLLAAHGEGPCERFPWGDRFHDQYAFNWRKNVGDTTPVGIYQRGMTDSGVGDLLGNVWEWTSDCEEGRYLLRGGAWDTMDLDKKGFEAEIWESPSTCRGNIGFRIIEELK